MHALSRTEMVGEHFRNKPEDGSRCSRRKDNPNKEKEHMKKPFIITVAMLAAALTAQAQQEPTLAELQAQLQELSAKIARLEQQQEQKIAALEQRNAEQIAEIKAENSAQIEKMEAAKPMELPEWVTSTKFKGDFRYRYENIDEDNRVKGNRQRIRVRVGAYGQVNDYIDYGVRVATGGGATSANQTLGDTQNGMFDLWLDRAYVDIHHEKMKGAHVILGKMAQPWVARTGLIWDSDLNPEGIAVTYDKKLSDSMSLYATAGSFIIDDENINAAPPPATVDGGDDPRMWAGQLALNTRLGDKTDLQIGVSDYWFENVDYYGLAAAPANTANSGFNLVEGFGSVSGKAGDLPVKVYGQVVKNTEAADSSQDLAYLVGCTLGKAKKPGSWEVGYNWRDTQNDAVVRAFHDSDFAGQDTGSYGHLFKVKYQIAENWQAGATYIKAVNGAGRDEDTFQADLNFKF